eukprot:1147675-Pelagomonas_calceolata.AAC.12
MLFKHVALLCYLGMLPEINLIPMYIHNAIVCSDGDNVAYVRSLALRIGIRRLRTGRHDYRTTRSVAFGDQHAKELGKALRLACMRL